MKKRYAEEQIIGFLREADAGLTQPAPKGVKVGIGRRASSGQ